MKQTIKNCLALLVFIVAFALLFALIQTQHIWGDVYIEQILINLNDGISAASDKLLLGYVFSIILGVISATALSFVLKSNKYLYYISVGIFLFVTYQIGVFSYFLNKTVYSKIYEQEYVSPESLNYTFSEGKRNLIVVYLESIEANYATSPYLEQNLIPNIYAKQKTSLSFDGFYQLKRQDYTLAAMVESMCAVPYRKTNLKGREAYQNFLAGLTCYPQILQKNGYHTVFMKGADIDFALTGLFMRSHGFEVVMGKDELENKFKIPLSQNEGAFGGYQDAALYEMVKKELLELNAQNEPFFLSFLTLDTHAPDYYLSPTCKGDPKNTQDIVRCADSMLHSFLEWLARQDFYLNTTVVVLGDHPETGKNSLYPREKNRQIVNFILNPSPVFQKEPHNVWTTLDVAPTVLNALGIYFQDGSFGLGRSLFQKEPTLIEKTGLKLETELSKSSEVYDSFDVVKNRSLPRYHLYAPLGIEINEPEKIAHYATYSKTFVDAVFLDELSFLLPQNEYQKIILNIQFKVLLSGMKEQKIKVFANDIFLEEISISMKDIPLASKQIEIPANILKNQKLSVRFETEESASSASLLGIGVVSFSLSPLL